MISKDMGSDEDYQDYLIDCEDLGLPPVSREDFEIAGMQYYANNPQPAPAAGSIEALDSGLRDARIIDELSGANIRLHIALSTALGLDFEPTEDIERYTDAIAVLIRELAEAKKLKQEVGTFLDDNSDFSAGQRRLSVSAEHIKTLMNAYDAAARALGYDEEN